MGGPLRTDGRNEVTPSIVDARAKAVFRAGYECACVLVLETGGGDHEQMKFITNYMIRDIYFFFMAFNTDAYFEYATKCDMDHNYLNSELSSVTVDAAAARFMASEPEMLQTYLLSRLYHVLLFGIRLNLAAIIPFLRAPFEQLLALHRSHDCWSYPAQLKESLHVTYECLTANVWPPKSLIRHFYICLAEPYQLTKSDLIRTIFHDKPAVVLEKLYRLLFPQEYQVLLNRRNSRLDTVVFDDTVAYYEYLKHENPILLQDYADAFSDAEIRKMLSKARSRKELSDARMREVAQGLMALKKLPEDWLKNNPELLPPFKGARKKLSRAEEEYKNLPNLEKIKYVNLANCVTSDEIAFASIMIAPSFECDMIMKDGFVDAHEV